MRSVPIFQAVAGFSPFFADCPPFLRAPLFFHFFFPAIFRYRHALQCAKAMILAAQAPAISPHSFLFRNRSVDGCFSSAIRANHCFFLLLRPTPALRAVVGFGAAVLLRSVLTPRCFAPFFAAYALTFGGAQASPLRCPVGACSRLGALHPSLRPTPLRVVGFASAERQSRCPQRSFRFAQPSWRPTLLRVVGFGAAVLLRSVLTPRCFAPFFAAYALTFGGA